MPANTLKKPLIRVALGVGLLLLVPAVAMQFTNEVSWGPGDFVAGGALLFAAGAATLIVRRCFSTAVSRASLTMTIALCFGLIWAELAVGLFH